MLLPLGIGGKITLNDDHNMTKAKTKAKAKAKAKISSVVKKDGSTKLK
jgi:hypothetical protein